MVKPNKAQAKSQERREHVHHWIIEGRWARCKGCDEVRKVRGTKMKTKRICGSCYSELPNHSLGCPRDPLHWLVAALQQLTPEERDRVKRALRIIARFDKIAEEEKVA